MTKVANVDAVGLDRALGGHRLVMVDFWSPDCIPCQTLSPILDDLAAICGRRRVPQARRRRRPGHGRSVRRRRGADPGAVPQWAGSRSADGPQDAIPSLELAGSAAETRAFHGDPALKADLLARMRQHAGEGTLVFGATRWDGVRGSPLGISAASEDSGDYAARFGFPLAVAGLLDPLMSAMLRDPAAAAIAWVEAVAPGDDLSAVPMHILEELLVRLKARELAPVPYARVAAVHLQEALGHAQDRTSWSALRTDIEAAAAAAEGSVRLALDACAIACWSLTTSRSVLASLLHSWLAQAPPASDTFDAADRARAQAVLEALWRETAPARDAGDPVDLPALFRRCEPVLAAGFEADLHRANTVRADRAGEALDIVLRHLIAASPPPSVLADGGGSI